MKENRPLQPKTSLRQRIILVLFGLSLFFMLLEVGLRLGGFVLLSIQEYRNRQTIRQKGAYRIMCLGESTTAGQYPVFLEEILNQRNTGIRFSVIDKGIDGTTTSDILERLDFDLNNYHPDMVVTMMGINDWGKHIPYGVATTSKIMLFFQPFRTYKLTRLLWLHILTKAKEVGLYKPGEDKQRSGKIQTYLLRIGLKEAYAEPISTEDSFKKAIELNPKNDGAYIGLGRFYQGQGKFSQAEDSFKKTIELNPKNDAAYFELGRLYQNQGKFSQAEDLFRKAIELNPKNNSVYFELGRCYENQGKFSQAEDSFKKFIELTPKNDGAHLELGWFYQKQNEFSQAEDIFKKFIELNPENDRAYGAILVLYEETGKPELAKEYAKKANTMRLRYYNPVTVNNYLKLKEILDKRGIRLVCVQYPTRSIESLKKIFEGNEKGIIFVDNERIFRDAVKKGSSRTYFRDMFGGDFGHCTPKGNRLLARNIANVILKEVFGNLIH